MSRNLLQMTGKIFDEFATRVSEEHKEYIVSVNRHISISEENRAECCELLKDAIIIGRRHDYLPTVVFIKYKEAMRRDERINALAILKIAGMPLIHKMYILLFNESEGDNELERINNWIYDKRCSIAHFRYGQQKNEETYVNEEILEMMLELLVGIFSNINQNMKDICSGLVKLEESTLA